MEIKDQIGHTAGEVWQLLQQDGPQSLARLRRQLNGHGELPVLAVGWLAREDKVDLLPDRKSLRVQLK